MLAIYFIVALVAQFTIKQSLAMDRCGMALTKQMNNYCSQRHETFRAFIKGRDGPRGPRGLTNYTVIEAVVAGKVQRKCRLTHVDCTRFHSKTSALSSTETGGVFRILPSTYPREIKVNCDLTTDGGGWMIFQKRMNGRTDFERGREEYLWGFGEPEGEYWMGLEKLHRLTSEGEFELRIDLEDWEGNTAFAQYSTFSIGSASTIYQLTVSGYSGNAGDSLSSNNAMKFYSENLYRDNNECLRTSDLGGWWFSKCNQANLNGRYIRGGRVSFWESHSGNEGIIWYHWKGSTYSLKSTEMKFRPKF